MLRHFMRYLGNAEKQFEAVKNLGMYLCGRGCGTGLNSSKIKRRGAAEGVRSEGRKEASG
jgi:hypothetical protein